MGCFLLKSQHTFFHFVTLVHDIIFIILDWDMNLGSKQLGIYPSCVRFPGHWNNYQRASFQVSILAPATKPLPLSLMHSRSNVQFSFFWLWHHTAWPKAIWKKNWQKNQDQNYPSMKVFNHGDQYQQKLKSSLSNQHLLSKSVNVVKKDLLRKISLSDVRKWGT